MSTMTSVGVGMIGRAPKVSGLKKPRPLRRQTSSTDQQPDMKPSLHTESVSVSKSLVEKFKTLTITTKQMGDDDSDMLSDNEAEGINNETAKENNNSILKQRTCNPFISGHRSSVDSIMSSLSDFQTNPEFDRNTGRINMTETENFHSGFIPNRQRVFSQSSDSGCENLVPSFSRQSSDSGVSCDQPSFNHTSSQNAGESVYNTRNGENTGYGNRKENNNLTEELRLEGGNSVRSNCHKDFRDIVNKGLSEIIDKETSSFSLQELSSYDCRESSSLDYNKNLQSADQEARDKTSSDMKGFSSNREQNSSQIAKNMWASAQQMHKARMEDLQNKLGRIKQPDPQLLKKQIQQSREAVQDVYSEKEKLSSSNEADICPSYTCIINMDGEKLVLASRCLKTLMKAANKICQMKDTNLLKVESTDTSDIQPGARKTKLSISKPEAKYSPVKVTQQQNLGQGDCFGQGYRFFNEQMYTWHMLDKQVETKSSTTNEDKSYKLESKYVRENIKKYTEKKLLSLAKSSVARTQPKNWHLYLNAFPEICLLNQEGDYFNPFDLKACNPEAVMPNQPGVFRV